MRKKKIYFLISQKEKQLAFTNSHVSDGYDIEFIDFHDARKEGVGRFVKRVISEFKSGKRLFDGIVGFDDTTSFIASLINAKTTKRGPSPKSIFSCQNKYLSRILQKKVIEHHIPDFFLASEYVKGKIDKRIFPYFFKPVRSTNSFYSFRVNSPRELREAYYKGKKPQERINKQYTQLLKTTDIVFPYMHTYSDFLCESLLPAGTQITLDGFVAGKKVVFFGVTKSIFLPNSLSFTQFDYPYFFPRELHEHVEEIARKMITVLGLKDTLFNIEMIVDEKLGHVNVVEINSRVSSQFIPLFRLVTGYDPLEAMCDLSVGNVPTFQGFDASTARYGVCSSCVLRKKENQTMKRIPTQDCLDDIHKKYPNVRVHVLASQGSKLSDLLQDTETFRYAFLTIPGKDSGEVARIRKDIESRLDIIFESVK